MSENYDNWEKLVRAVLRRQHDKEIAMSSSRNTTSSISRGISSSRSTTSTSPNHESLIYDEQSHLLHAGSFDSTNDPPQNQETIATGSVLRNFLRLLYSYMCCLDQRTGSKSYIVGAGDLAIAWGDISQYWKWERHADSRFPRVAVLVHVWWLDIKGKIKTRMLSPNTTYAAYLVFKLARGSCGLESANAYVRFTDDESSGDAESRAEVVDLVQVSESRAGGWMEVEIGSFYNDDKGGDGEVEARFMEIKRLHRKSGLIVGGIELRSKCGSIAFSSKHVIRRKPKGSCGSQNRSIISSPIFDHLKNTIRYKIK